MRAAEEDGGASAGVPVVRGPDMAPALMTGQAGTVAAMVPGAVEDHHQALQVLQGLVVQEVLVGLVGVTASLDVIAGTVTAPATLMSSRSQTQVSLGNNNGSSGGMR